MERKSLRWPWFTALILCVCVAVCSAVFTVIRIQNSIQPQQPDYVRLQYDKLFSDPDWEELYAMSAIDCSVFEDGSVVAAYMKRLVGDKSLTIYDDSLSAYPYHVFNVFSDNRCVAWFSLNKSDMSLKNVHLVLEARESVWVNVPMNVTVLVNGIALDDSYLAYSMHTKAENYLPDGVHGARMKGYFVSDLLMPPTVTAVDQNGDPVALFVDEESGAYYAKLEDQPEITEQQRQFVAGAATADALYALAKVSNKELAAYIDPTSDLYKMLTDNPRNYQKFHSIWVEDVEVGEFCQYSETLFSANVTLTQQIIRTSGTRKTYYLDKTYLFELQDDGEYRVIAYTNEHLTDKVETVKLTFNWFGDETMTQMVDMNATSVTGPDMSQYRGFRGWAVETQREDYSVQATIRILPDGTVLGGLEPMVLKPVFSIE